MQEILSHPDLKPGTKSTIFTLFYLIHIKAQIATKSTNEKICFPVRQSDTKINAEGKRLIISNGTFGLPNRKSTNQKTWRREFGELTRELEHKYSKNHCHLKMY